MQPESVESVRDFLYNLLERGNGRFAAGDPIGAIRHYEQALQSFLQLQQQDQLRPVFQKLWTNKAMAHQQLRQHARAQEAAMVANTLADALMEQPVSAEAAARACRRCGAGLADGSREGHGGADVTRCNVCGYRNVVAARAIPLKFLETMRQAGFEQRGAVLLAEARRTGDAQPALQQALRELIGVIIEWIHREPAAAAARVWHDLQHAEEQLDKSHREELKSDITRSATLNATALLYVLSARPGLPEVDAKIEDASREITELVWTAATSAVTIGTMLRAVKRGELVSHVVDDDFVMEPTEYYLELAEWRINRHHDYGREPTATNEELNRIFDEVLALVRGYRLGQLVDFIDEVARQVQRHYPPGTPVRVLWPKCDVLTPAERAMLDDWSLTPERVSRFASPFYLDLGESAGDALTDVELGERLALNAWAAYYPIFPVRRNGNEHALVPVGATNLALVNLEIFKSRLLEELFDAARSAPAGSPVRDPRLSKRLGRLRTEANRLAEQRASRALDASGWRAATGFLITEGGRSEEIDLLAARTINHRLVVLLGEVKDFDLGLQRVSAQRNFRRRVSEAQAQLVRKAGVLQRTWQRTLHEHLQLTADEPRAVELYAMLVTSQYLPLAWFEQCAVLCEDDLPELADRLDQPGTQNVLGRGRTQLR